jgi:hypothetical protein
VDRCDFAERRRRSCNCDSGHSRSAFGERRQIAISRKSKPPTSDSILPVDFSYDFKTDLVLVGESGVRFFRQDSPSAFTDVTNETKLPAATLNRNYQKPGVQTSKPMAIWTSCSEEQKAPVPVLRNNGDGTFTEIQPFGDVSTIQVLRGRISMPMEIRTLQFRGSSMHVFSNERQGNFRSVLFRTVTSPVRHSTLWMSITTAYSILVLVKNGVIIRAL